MDIIVTLGPASHTAAELCALMRAGMTTARINCSHASSAEIRLLTRTVRAAAAKTGTKVKVMLDVQGPKMRLGHLLGDLHLKTGREILLAAEEYHERGAIPVQYANIVQDAKKGDTILIGDGSVSLLVLKKEGHILSCRVLTGGKIKSHQGITLPGAYKPHVERITNKDFEDALSGIAAGMDEIALSFVQEAKDITLMRDFLAHHKSSARIIAKIEHPRAIEHLVSILKVVDGVMVARGDLALQIGGEHLLVAEEKILSLAKKHGKYCIVATQILESMVESPVPTRAEMIDIAYSARLGADALMLSDETSVGAYPVEAVATLKKIAEVNAVSKKK